ncbi:hypothetical protein A2U01_0098663 [Trifolium medium]|nr:hypothetical protein [Trifolium medium]
MLLEEPHRPGVLRGGLAPL